MASALNPNCEEEHMKEAGKQEKKMEETSGGATEGEYRSIETSLTEYPSDPSGPAFLLARQSSVKLCPAYDSVCWAALLHFIIS